MHRLYARGRLALAVAFALIAGAPGRADPSFRGDKEYPNLGLRLRVLGDSTPEPLAPPKTYTYTYTTGSDSFKQDKFDPVELWYATQHAGQWRDSRGNVLILGRATHLLPAFADQHVMRATFDKALEAPAAALDPGSLASLGAWFSAFSGCRTQAPVVLRPPSFHVAHAVFFPVAEPATLLYAFRVKTRGRNGHMAPSDWYGAILKIGDGTATAKARKDFETQLLGSVAASSRSSVAATGVQPKELTPANSRSRPPPAIPDSPSRSAARKSIANMKDWWFAETPGYIFLSNVRSSEGRDLIAELQLIMPSLHEAYAALIPPLEPVGDVGVVRIYDDADAYRQYVGEERAWTCGVWLPMSRELVIQSQGQERSKTLEIIRHEGFHQYLFYACGMRETAPWFNEGHACFFEAADVDRRGRVSLEENGMVELLVRNLETVTGRLPVVLQMDYAEFYRGTADERQLNYATAWALVYFLWKGAPLERPNPYAGVIDGYLQALAGSRDTASATAAAFRQVDMAALQKDFAEFWKRRRASARRIDPLAERAQPSPRPAGPLR